MVCKARHPRNKLHMWPLSVWLTVLIMGAGQGCLGQGGKPVRQDDTLIGRPYGHEPDAEPTRSGGLWYQLEVEQDQLQVRLRLLEPAPRASFFLPGPWAGRDDFAEAIVLGQARGPQGPLPMTLRRDQGRIDVESESGTAWLELHYTVQMHRLDDDAWRFRPHRRPAMVFAYAPTFLVLPSDQVSRQIRDIPVELRLPSQWDVVTTWPAVAVVDSRVNPEQRVHGFIVEDVRSLRDAFVAAGKTLDIHHTRAAHRPLTIAFEADFEGPYQHLVEPIATIVTAYVERFGFDHEITVFVRHNALASPQTMRGMGRRRGFVLELPQTPRVDPTTLLLIAHEAFHVWNGHELVPEPSHEPRTRWFKEGLTHYVALQTLHGLGLIDERFVREELARTASNYLRNPVFSGQPATALDEMRFPYDQGMLVALLLDAAIRQGTSRRQGLQDWIAALLDDYRRHPRRQYDEQALRQSLIEFLAARDPGPVQVWDRYVTRRSAIDVPGQFESLGLHWLEGRDEEPARLLPLERGGGHYLTLFPGLTRASPTEQP
jgi:predicted metalloprotease with PDZ domain